MVKRSLFKGVLADTKKIESEPLIRIGPAANGQILYFFSARHTNNPRDEQFNFLRQFWTEFLQATEGRERLVFIEGAIRETPDNFDDAIRQQGESGAMQNLAQQANVPVQCSEPGDTEQRRSLCGQSNPHDVAYMFIIQNLASWFRQTNPTLNFQKSIEYTLRRESKFKEIYGFAPSYDWLHKQHYTLFGEQKLDDAQFLYRITDPRTSDTKINILVATRTQIRNDYIFQRIKDAWNSGKNIFIVYGRGHAIVLLERLRGLTD